MKKGLVLVSILAVFAILASGAYAGQLVLKGSTTVLPIAQKVAEAYMKAYKGSVISISGGGSSNGIKAIIDGTTDIGNASRFIKDSEVKLAVDKGVYPVPHRIALDCIVPIVHPSTNVSNLSIAQLRDIYTGKITSWKEVGGADAKIIVISRDSSSGTFDAWESLVMNKERVAPTALTVPSNGALVTQVGNTKNTIGYIALGYITKKVKTLKVEGVQGSVETTLNGKYKISRPLFMFTNGWPKGETLNFLNFILSKEGQKLIAEAGSIALY